MTNVIYLKSDAFSRIPSARHMSQQVLAERIGVTRHTVRRATEGAPVSAAFVAGACLAFSVRFDALFEARRVETPAAA